MDPSLLIHPSFWDDPRPFAAAPLPDLPELEGQVLFETSGSSGRPKWIALSKLALLVSAGAVNRHLGVDADCCWGLALPLHHVGGFGVAARAFAADCRMEVLPKRWEAVVFRDWLGTAGVTHTSLVPTQVHDLVKARLAAPAGVRAIVVGGGKLDVETGRVARALGWPVLASYGMTEAGSQIVTQSLESLESLYQDAPIPLLPVWDARLTQEGLLAISGAALFSGRLEDGVFVPRAAEWHVTSDRALLESRLLTPLGRADLLVKVLGELVDPEAIERELVAISGGKIRPGGVAVIAVPDARTEHALVPVFEAPADSGSLAGILGIYHDLAPGYRRLRQPVIVPAFPRSGLGKLKRADLTILCGKLT